MHEPAASERHCGKHKQKFDLLPAYAARRPLLPKLAASGEIVTLMDNPTQIKEVIDTHLIQGHVPTDIVE